MRETGEAGEREETKGRLGQGQKRDVSLLHPQERCPGWPVRCKLRDGDEEEEDRRFHREVRKCQASLV